MAVTAAEASPVSGATEAAAIAAAITYPVPWTTAAKASLVSSAAGAAAAAASSHVAVTASESTPEPTAAWSRGDNGVRMLADGSAWQAGGGGDNQY